MRNVIACGMENKVPEKEILYYKKFQWFMNAQVEATAKQLLGFCADNAEAKLDTVSSWKIKGIGKAYSFNCLGVCDQFYK